MQMLIVLIIFGGRNLILEEALSSGTHLGAPQRLGEILEDTNFQTAQESGIKPTTTARQCQPESSPTTAAVGILLFGINDRGKDLNIFGQTTAMEHPATTSPGALCMLGTARTLAAWQTTMLQA